MPSFPIIQQQADGRHYRVVSDFRAPAVRGWLYMVLAGFVYDGASVPRIFWRLIGSPFTGLYAPAALVHDVLYGAQVTTRKEADGVFLALMKVYGVGFVKRQLIYRALRIGGWASWRRKTADDIAEAKGFLVMSAANDE